MRQAFQRHPGNILDECDDLEANCQTFGDYQPQQQPQEQQPQHPQLILLAEEQQQVLRCFINIAFTPFKEKSN